MAALPKRKHSKMRKGKRVASRKFKLSTLMSYKDKNRRRFANKKKKIKKDKK